MLGLAILFHRYSGENKVQSRRNLKTLSYKFIYYSKIFLKSKTLYCTTIKLFSVYRVGRITFLANENAL